MASFLSRLFGGGGGAQPMSTSLTKPLAANPYQVGGVQPVNIGGFRPAPSNFQWGGSPATRSIMGMPSFGGVGAFDAMGALGRPAGMSRYLNPDDEAADALGYGKEKPSKRGKMGRIKDLLTGESGAAIGGIAQGAGSVIGAYLNRKANQEMTKLERDKFEEEKRMEAAREEQRKILRALLMPAIEQYRPR